MGCCLYIKTGIRHRLDGAISDCESWDISGTQLYNVLREIKEATIVWCGLSVKRKLFCDLVRYHTWWSSEDLIVFVQIDCSKIEFRRVVYKSACSNFSYKFPPQIIPQLQIPRIHNPRTFLHPTSIAYSLFLTARGRSKEYFSIPGTTPENLELKGLLLNATLSDEKVSTTGVTQENLELPLPSYSLDSHQTQNNQMKS